MRVDQGGDPRSGRHERSAALAGLRAYLSILDRERLVDLLIEAARRDPATERGLHLAVRRAEGAARRTDDLSALRAAVERAFASSGPLGFWPAVRYAQGAGEVADALDTLVRDGRAGDARPLLERAVALLLRAHGRDAHPDDPDDRAEPFGELMRRLLASHARACAATGPDPVVLAGWLARLHCEQGWFAAELGPYLPALAETGLAAYRAEVGRRRAVAPADRRVRRAAEQLARLDGDVDTLVAVIGGDLRQAAQYGRLARALHDIGATEEALYWAERGLRAHPDDPPTAGLRDFLVQAYLQRGDAAAAAGPGTGGQRPADRQPLGGPDAVALRRAGLRATPHLRAYAALRAAAGYAGCWPAERAAALRLLRRHNPADHVRALLYEEHDPAAAWAAAARVPGLDGATWDELARHRARDHPAQAVPVLRRRIDEVLAGAGREVYRDAARRLAELREVSARAGQAAEFDAYLRTLLDRHRRRPSLLAELAEAGLTPIR